MAFPVVDQLTDGTTDGQPSENASWDCVPASLSAAIRYVTGREIHSDTLKDGVYGQGYTGGMAAAAFVDYCRSLGVHLYAIENGSGAQLVSAVHACLARNVPVLMTIPSQWNTAPVDPLHPAGSTHVVCAAPPSTPDSITAMNPWHGFMQTQPDSWWSARLCFGEVWGVEIMALANYVPDGTWWKDTRNGNHVGQGLYDYADREQITAPLIVGEQPWKATDPDTIACWGDGNASRAVVWDSTHGAPTESWNGHVIADLIAERNTANANASQAAQNAQQTAAQLAQVQGEVATLQAQLATLQAQLAQAQQAAAGTPGEVEALAAVRALAAALKVAP